MKSGKSIMARGRGNKKIFQYCIDSAGEILYLRALQGHAIAILLILHHKTMSWFRTISSNTFITLDVQSIQDWYREVKIWAKDRQSSFCLWILWTKKHKDPEKIDLEAPRLARYMHTAWKKHQNTVYWVDNYTCSKERIKSFIKLDRTPSFFTVHSQAYCIPRVVQMVNWRNNIRKSKWITSTASEDYFEKWLDEGIGFRSCSTNRRQPTKPTKLWSNLKNGETRCDQNKRPLECSGNRYTFLSWLQEYQFDCWTLRERHRHRRRRLMQIEIERRDPLWVDNNNRFVPHSSKRWTSILGRLDCHMQLWNKPKILVFASPRRRSRITLIDKLFKPIYNKVTPTTHLVRNQRRWWRTWAM